MSLLAKVRKPGYIYIYLSNENEVAQEVYFDDLAIKHVKGVAEQENDYYPFGLTFNSYQRENSVEQRWKFQGQEHIDDLGLNWDSFKWRNHQPDIGRFFNVDPLAEDYYYNSPYAFSENKVIAHREIEGLEAQTIHTNPTEEASAAVAEGIATDLFGIKHAFYNVVLAVVGSDTRATFVQNEDGDYETGFVETEESTGEYFVNLGLDLLNLASFGKGPGAILARTGGKNSIINNGKKTFKQIQEEVRLDKEKALQQQQQQQKQQQKAEQAKAKAKQKQGSAEHTKNKRGSTENKHEKGQSRKQADQERSNNPNKKEPQQ